jgi:RNA polymerase sigma-70 factor, ECF subfamily
MIASLNGDGGVYHAFLEGLTGHLRAYYRHRFALIGHGPTKAEDLLQEVFITMHTHRHTYDPSQPFTPRIYTIARYKFLDYLRRTKFSFKNLPMESAEELTASSEFGAVESSLDLQRLMLRISSKAAVRLNRAVMEFVYYCRR